MPLRALALIFVSFVSASAYCGPAFTLVAAPGEFNVKTVGESAPRGTLSASLRLVSFDGADGWPPAAYVGFYEGFDRGDSIQFLIIRNRKQDGFLVAGYRLIERGRETKVESLANVALTEPVRVMFQFNEGVASLSINGGRPVVLRTSLRRVAPYVSVSSGSAEFEIDP